MIGSFSNKAHSRIRPLCVLSVMLLIQAAAVSVFALSVPSARNPPTCNARIGPVRLVSGVDVGHFGERDLSIIMRDRV